MPTDPDIDTNPVSKAPEGHHSIVGPTDADQPQELDEPSLGDISSRDADIVDEPEQLMEAEARVTGRTLAELKAWLSTSFTEWLGPRGGWLLLTGAVILWLWTTYNR